MLVILLLLFENMGAFKYHLCGRLPWMVSSFISPSRVVSRIQGLKEDVAKDLVGYTGLPKRWTEATECLGGKSYNRLLQLSTIDERALAYRRY
jgi:hypothetical protein